jgi:hypothetical protein
MSVFTYGKHSAHIDSVPDVDPRKMAEFVK